MSTRTKRRAPAALAALALLGLSATGGAAAEPEGWPAPVAQAAQPQAPPASQPATPPPAPNTGRVSLSAGVDYTTDYYFRGIRQETHDYIVQPYAEINFRLYEGEGALTSVDVAAGLWNSLHGGPTGADGPTVDPKFWYEADFYARLGTTLFEDLTAALVYTAYMSPNDSFATVQELALSLSYSDAKLLGPFALNPSLLIARELRNQADGGTSKGTYMQIGIAPGVSLFEGGPVQVDLSFPLAVGLSLDDYYEFGTGDDDTFGYFSSGIAAAVPLKFIPAAFGSWQARAGVTFLKLGDNLKAVNNRDSFEVIGTWGLAFAY